MKRNLGSEIEVNLLISYIASNKKRLVSFLIAILLLFVSPYFKRISVWLDGLFYKSRLYFPLKSSLINDQKAISEVLTTLFDSAIFALLVYAFFSSSLEKWLGHQIRETPNLRFKSLIDGIKSSKKEVIIQETFVQDLIENHHQDFITALLSFLNNCLKQDPQNLNGRVKVLLLHPFCKDIKARHVELQKKVARTEEEFLELVHRLLLETKKVQDIINKEARRYLKNSQNNEGDFFEIRLCYDKPRFSLYYCDAYASLSYYDHLPSSQAPQLVFFNADKIDAARKQKDFFKEKWIDAIPLSHNYNNPEIVSVTDMLQFEEVIKSFKDLASEKDAIKIKESLLRLSNVCEGNYLYIIELINYVESNHKKNKVNYKSIDNQLHFNIFGTGGDNPTKRSLNISTISSILASHYTDSTMSIYGFPVIKCGTLAVTGKVGSQTFYEKLQAILQNNRIEEEYKHLTKRTANFLDYNPKNISAYLPIMYFGYIYREVVRRIRKDINEQGVTDIFKLVFPAANLTGYKAIINGVSKKKYRDSFEKIYKTKRITGIIVYNYNEMDELFEGWNDLLYYQNGECVHKENMEITIPDSEKEDYINFFRESDPDEHVEKFIKLFDTQDIKIPKSVRETISYNIALFVQLSFLSGKKYSLLSEKDKTDLTKEILNIHMIKIYNFFFNQDAAYTAL